jgi:hypothetical protein
VDNVRTVLRKAAGCGELLEFVDTMAIQRKNEPYAVSRRPAKRSHEVGKITLKAASVDTNRQSSERKQT